MTLLPGNSGFTLAAGATFTSLEAFLAANGGLFASAGSVTLTINTATGLITAAVAADRAAIALGSGADGSGVSNQGTIIAALGAGVDFADQSGMGLDGIGIRCLSHSLERVFR